MSPTPDNNPPASSVNRVTAAAELASRTAGQAAWSGSAWQVLGVHRRWIATVLRARGVDAEAVEDLLQEVSAAAIENGWQLRDPQKVAPWLYRIAVVRALQYRRRLGRRRKLVKRFAATQSESTVSCEPDPLVWLLADEQRQLVQRALADLPAKDAEILLLKHTEDWSYRQLAEHLGASESAIDARLHRARAKLRRVLARMCPALVPRHSEPGTSSNTN